MNESSCPARKFLRRPENAKKEAAGVTGGLKSLNRLREERSNSSCRDKQTVPQNQRVKSELHDTLDSQHPPPIPHIHDVVH